MKTPPVAFLIVLLAGAASAQQQGSTSYTPDRKTDAPTFMNAEVVRVDRASNKITFRSESRETTLTVEGEALRTIESLNTGDKVVVGYRVVKDADGREIRYVTSVTTASPASGDPRRVTTNTTGVQSATSGAASVPTAGVPGAGSSVSPNTASATTGAVPQGAQQGGGVPQGSLPGNQATTGVTAGGQSTSGGQVVGGAVGGQTSPLLNPVPNVSGASPVPAAVLPPAVAKQPLSADEVGMMRAQGEADLDGGAMALSTTANAIDTAWAGFKAQCLPAFNVQKDVQKVTSGREWFLLARGQRLTPTDDSCRALQTDLTNRAQGFMQQLDTVEDAARKADVLPVRVREVFDRHRLR